MLLEDIEDRRCHLRVRAVVEGEMEHRTLGVDLTE
jgi:hypothetical protein